MRIGKEEAKEMSVKQGNEYCNWCWGSDYGNCDNCYVGHGKKKKDLTEQENK